MHAETRFDRGIARGLLATALSTAPWRAGLFMVLSFALGVAAFVCLVTAITVGIGTLVIWIGIPILVATMVAWRWAAQFERLRIRLLLGVEIETPYRAPAEGGFLRRLRTQVADPASWRDLLYLFLLFPVGIAELVVFTGGLGFALGLLATPLPGRAGDSIQLFGPRTAASLPATLVLCLLGILALVLVLNLFVGVAWLHARGARLLLGTSGGDRLRERVTVLADSRSRAVASALDERRQIERDLHDGAQQRLVALALDLGLAREQIEHDPEAARGLVERGARRGQAGARGAARPGPRRPPAVLTDRGLDAALSGARGPLARAGDRPRRRRPTGRRPRSNPPPTSSSPRRSTNVAKHAGADPASVGDPRGGRRARVEISTTAAAAPMRRGTGLRGLRDRVAALDGRFAVDARPGADRSARSCRARRDRRGLGPAARGAVAAAGRGRASRSSRRRRRRRAAARGRPSTARTSAVVDVRMPPTHTDEGLRAAVDPRAAGPGARCWSCPSTSRSATRPSCWATAPRRRLPAQGPGRRRRRVPGRAASGSAAGGTVLDPEVVAQLLARGRRRDPLERADPARARGARADGARAARTSAIAEPRW